MATVDPQMCTLCLGNLPKLMHNDLESKLRNLFQTCPIVKIFLLENYNFCFIRFNTPAIAKNAEYLVKSTQFCKRILTLEKHSPEQFVPSFRDQIAELYQNGLVGQVNSQQQQQQPQQIPQVVNVQQQQIPLEQQKPVQILPFLEVLDLPLDTDQQEFLDYCLPFGATNIKIKLPTARVFCHKERREELYTALNDSIFKNKKIRVRYPPYFGPKSKLYRKEEPCRIIVEGIGDPDHEEVSNLITARFAAFGRVMGTEILRNRSPSCAFIDIERNAAEIAVKGIDGEYFFGQKLTVAILKQDSDVIVIDSEEEADEQLKKLKSTIPSNQLLPSKITIPSPNNVARVVDLMCERQRLEVLHPYEEYLLQIAPENGAAGLDDSEPLPNPPQQFIRLLMDRAIMKVKLMKLANANQ